MHEDASHCRARLVRSFIYFILAYSLIFFFYIGFVHRIFFLLAFYFLLFLLFFFFFFLHFLTSQSSVSFLPPNKCALGYGSLINFLSYSTPQFSYHHTETTRYYSELKRFNYTTPTSYLELIKLYMDILKRQQEKISANERRYRVGLDKLKETEEIVAKLEVSFFSPFFSFPLIFSLFLSTRQNNDE